MDIVILCVTTRTCNLIARQRLKARNVKNVGQIQTGSEEPADELGFRRWLREGVLATVLLAIGQGAALFSLLLISRRILPAEFGKLSVGLALQNYVVLLGTLGLRTLVVRDLARSPQRLPQIWGTYWALIIPFGVIVALGGHTISGLTFEREPAEEALSLWLAIGAWFSILSLVPMLDGLNRQVQALGIVALTEGLFLTGLHCGCIPLNLVGLGAGFALKWTLASTMQAAVLWMMTRPERLLVSRDVLQSWQKSAPWLLATALISHLPFALCVVLVRGLRDASEAAVIGLAVQIATGVLLIAGLAFRFVQPMLRTVDDLRSERVRIAIHRACAGLIGVWLLGAGAAWVLTIYWLPATFHKAWPTFLVLLTAALFGGVAYLLWAMLNALDMAASILAGYLAGAGLCLCGSLILIPIYGHLGGAWAVWLATLLTAVVMLREVRRGLRRQQPTHVQD
jgi:O-antigen/teichoic acid export membrane protein